MAASVLTRLLSPPMRVHVVDPSAYTPPYDHALCRALGEAGQGVELFSSRFKYGSIPAADAYTRHESFYRRSHSLGDGSGHSSRSAMALKLAEHVPDMLRYRQASRSADVVHFQWLTVQPLDIYLLPRGRPLVLTAHDVLPREPRPGQIAAQKRLYERMDAVVVHSAHGRRRLIDELGIDQACIHVIPHGVLEPWGRLPEQPLPESLRDANRPVVLFFGLLRPYKGLEVLIDAWQGIQGAELWIVGMPRMDISKLRADAGENVRFLSSFISDAQIPALMRRASFLVAPYHEIDQSGVLFTALGSGTPLLLSDAGGFPEIAATGAARIFKAGDSDGLRMAIKELLADPASLAHMAQQAKRAAQTDYSWKQIAGLTIKLYEQLLRT